MPGNPILVPRRPDHASLSLPDSLEAAEEGGDLMREFFRGWRRKAGVMTLVMATVFLGAWVRNVVVTDQFELVIGDSTNYFTSTEGYFRWTRHAQIIVGDPSVMWYSVPHGSPWQPLDEQAAIEWRWRWNWCLFDFGSGLFRGVALVEWTLPCWIGFPLTGLSAALLILSPPKARRIKAPAEGPLKTKRIVPLEET